MANNYIHNHIQSVLVPKEQFKSLREAQAHVEKMGFDPNFKQPHITDNYYRFRQYNPRSGEKFKTIHLDGVSAVESVGSHNTKIISRDAFAHVKDPNVHKPIIEKQRSLHDFQPKLGANGHGVWLQQFKPEHLQDQAVIDNKTKNQRSNLTPAVTHKPWQTDQTIRKSDYEIQRHNQKHRF